MYSLIETLIAKPKKYAQLFISTHNLDFLKYLKKLTIPKFQPTPDSKPKLDINYFLVERINTQHSELKLAPPYLKNYITEFNYLFEQIRKCCTFKNNSTEHSVQYNFGNNMRKFLEAYLFYRYPNVKLSMDDRMSKFFDNDDISINLVNRVINEYSHLGEQFERGLEPVDLDVMQKIAVIVINRIKEVDPHQYEALLESIS